MSQPRPLLSEEMKATADAIHHVRNQLYDLFAGGNLPADLVPDATTVAILGLDVAAALERLADVPPQRTPTHLDERR
jgi:hypothetical protein